MSQKETYSPGPWKWIDFGVLGNANGEALLDYENWNVSPSDAALIQQAPELYECLASIRQKYGQKLSAEDLAKIDKCLSAVVDLKA